MVRVPQKRRLLKEVEKLTHAERSRRLALLGRDHAGTPGLRRLLDSLDEDLYQWQLRLVAAKAARESADLLAGLGHRSRSVRSSAIHGLRHIPVDSAALSEGLFSACSADRRAIIGVVRCLGDTGLADQLLERVFDRFGASEAAALVPACSPGQATDWLPRLDYGVTNWSSIARSHPTVFLGLVTDQMAASPIVRDAWWVRAGTGIARLVDGQPGEVLDLWQNFGPVAEVPACLRPQLRRLMSREPDRTLELLLRPAARAELAANTRLVRRHLLKASDDSLVRLAQALADDQSALAILLERLAPSKRESLFRRAIEALDHDRLRLSKALLDVLPHEVRHAETRRMLALAHFQDNPKERLEILGSLPIDECWDELRTDTEASDATVRAQSYRRLVLAVSGSRSSDYFSRLLEELQRLRNDQDPVRLAAMQALATVPPSLVEPRHMDNITNLARFAVEARDTSRATRTAMSRLLQRVLTSSAHEGGQAMIRPCVEALALLAEGGPFVLGPLSRHLPARGEWVLFEALEDQLRADVAAERYTLLISLASSLSRRGDKIPGLQELLRHAAHARVEANTRWVIQYWLQPRGTRTARAAELVSFDPSAILIDQVFETVSLARQDLLHIALGPDAPTGGFSRSTFRVVPIISAGTHRWTPSQRERYAELLEAAATNEHTRYRAAASVRALGRVPEAGEPRLKRLLDSPNVNLVEAALAGLSHAERPAEALDTLLSYAHSDRARVAIYAANRAARYTDPEQLTSALQRLLDDPASKVTSRKEALRILGQHRPPLSLQVMTDLWARRPLHRDIGIALASALRNYPDNDLTWDVLETMAHGSADEAMALTQTSAPLSWPAQHRTRLASLATPLANHHNSHVANAAWATLAQWRPWSEQVSQIIHTTITDLTNQTNLHNAIKQLHMLLTGYPTDPLLLNTVTDLAAQPPPPDSDAGHDRDLPLQQRLRALAHTRPNTTETRAAVRACGDHLTGAGYPTEALTFVMRSITWHDPDTTLHYLAQLATQHPQCVPNLHHAVHSELGSPANTGHWQPNNLLPAATELTRRATEPDALIALAVVSIAGPRSGWSAPWRDLLRTLRSHPSNWVKTQAQHTLTAPE